MESGLSLGAVAFCAISSSQVKNPETKAVNHEIRDEYSTVQRAGPLFGESDQPKSDRTCLPTAISHTRQPHTLDKPLKVPEEKKPPQIEIAIRILNSDFIEYFDPEQSFPSQLLEIIFQRLHEL